MQIATTNSGQQTQVQTDKPLASAVSASPAVLQTTTQAAVVDKVTLSEEAKSLIAQESLMTGGTGIEPPLNKTNTGGTGIEPPESEDDSTPENGGGNEPPASADTGGTGIEPPK